MTTNTRQSKRQQYPFAVEHRWDSWYVRDGRECSDPNRADIGVQIFATEQAALRRVNSFYRRVALRQSVARRAGIHPLDKLPAYAWPGGYDLIYYLADNSALCVRCAERERVNITEVESGECIEDGLWCDECSRMVIAQSWCSVHSCECDDNGACAQCANEYRGVAQ